MTLIAAHEVDIAEGSTQIYNGMDTCLTYEIFEELRSLPQPELIYNFERALQAPVLEMMLRGWRVDPDARQRGIERTRSELERLTHVLKTIVEAITDQPYNPKLPNSPKQLRELFYDTMHIMPITSWIKGEEKLPMDRDVLEQLWNHFLIRLPVQTILDIRDRSKTLSVLETEVDNDWRMRTSYNIGGTKTGRFSSSTSPEGSGTNLQNITEDLRHIFISDPGYKLGCVDLEQSDSRFVGFMCGILFNDWTYLDACESGDLHTSVARMIWEDLPWTGDLKKDRKIADRHFHRVNSYRQASKKIGHAANFLGGDLEISRQTSVPRKFVREFIERYFDRFPCIPRLHHWTARELQTKKRLTNVFGYSRDFFGRPEANDTLKKALAFLAASATGNCLNLGMWRTWKHMPEVRLTGQLHDAFYFQYREDADEAEVINKVKAFTTIEFIRNNRKFFVPVDAKVGWNWGPRYKEDAEGNTIDANPRGLDKFRKAA